MIYFKLNISENSAVVVGIAVYGGKDPAFKLHRLTIIILFCSHKKKAVAISPSTAICPWNLFCRDHSRVLI